MSKKKKHKSSAGAAAAKSANEHSSGTALQPTLVDQLLCCSDGMVLVKEHLQQRPEVLFFTTSAAFQTFQVADPREFRMPSVAVLDYLEFSSRALGMPEVAKLVKTNFPAAIMAYDEAIQSMDGEAIGRAIANAKGLAFLLI
ncbi:MAG TPA: hypothetical protein V6C86_04410 [Oculatellaceae cyanobacterium]